MNQELLLLLHALWMGILLLIVYDVLRILRGIIPHRNIWITIEDLCYWIVSALYIFGKMYQENHGMIRCFVFTGILLGMLFYHYTLSPFFVDFFVRLFQIPIKYGCLAIKRLLFVIKSCKIFVCRLVGKCLPKQNGNNKRLWRIEKNRKKTDKNANTKSSGNV